jgi:mono/diheme cytochrome c family protein
MSARLVIAFLICAWIAAAVTAETAAEEQSPQERQTLVEGAHLWSIYCNQCHNARPGSQFSSAQWEAITMHMKTLSNMPAKDMRAIKAFLELH